MFVCISLQIRWTKEVSVWPVGFVGGARWSGPVCSHGHVVGFHTKWNRNSMFPVDNAGFAVNIQLLIARKPHVKFLPIRERVQSKFLEKLTTPNKLEGLAEDCTKVKIRPEVCISANTLPRRPSDKRKWPWGRGWRTPGLGPMSRPRFPVGTSY